MKKTMTLGLLTLALAFLLGLVPGVTGATIGDASGPACRDITGPAFNYTSIPETPGVYNLNAQPQLGPAGTTAPCKNTTYTLYVIVDGSDPATATAYSQVGSNTWTGITVTDDDPNICVIATTSTGPAEPGDTDQAVRVFDTAPDSGCYPLTADTTGAPGGFN